MYNIPLLFLFVFIIGCKKEERLHEVSGVSQKVLFTISPGKDYSNHPDNYYLNLNLKLSRSAPNGQDLTIWDTIIRKKLLKSLQPIEVRCVINNTNHTTGVITAIKSCEYFYDDNTPFWAEHETTRLEHSEKNHAVSFHF